MRIDDTNVAAQLETKLDSIRVEGKQYLRLSPQIGPDSRPAEKCTEGVELYILPVQAVAAF
jgi:hypothetical protein